MNFPCGVFSNQWLGNLRFASGGHISKEQVEKEIDKDIARAASQTAIDFSENTPNADVMPLNWKLSGTNERPNIKILSAIEAHEKGHTIRHYDHFLSGSYTRD